MASRITIDVADDGSVSVSAEMDGAEPQMMQFGSVDEALESIEEMLGGETETPEAMWQQEAAAREAPMMTEEEMM